MTKFPKSLGDAEVSDIDLAQEDFQFEGQRLTEQRAEQLAERVFRASDNLIPGRKSLSGDSTHSPVVQARIPAAMHTQLQELADRRNVSVSRLLREAIVEFMKREEPHA